MIATAWAATVKFFVDNPIARWVVAAFLFIVGWQALKGHLKEAGAQAERAAIAKKQAEVKAAVTERTTEIISEERINADAAIEARDHGTSYPDSRSVPDPLQRVIFRD